MKNMRKIIPCLLAFLLLTNCFALYGSAIGEELALEPIDPATVPGAFLTSYAIIDELVGITDVNWTAEDGYMRAVTTGDSPQLRVYTPSDVNTTEYPYMAVRYRISSDWTSNWMYLADRTYNTGFSTMEGTWGSPKFVCDDQWHNAVFCFADDFPVMVDTDVFCIALPGADVIGEHLDVAHVAFFKTAEDAARFEGYVPSEPEEEPELEPIDPATVPGAFLTSYAIIDELVGITDVIWTAEDGFMRAVTTGGNPQLRIYTPEDVDTAEYPYMAVRYRISSDWDSDWMYLADRTYNTGFSTMTGTWGSPKYVLDNKWHNAVFYFPDDFPVMADTNVYCIRLPGADVIGEHLDVAHIAFFKTAEDAARFEGYVPSDPACTHNWVEATCTEPKTCSVCGETEGDALGHTWNDATCTVSKTCSVCGETEGNALGHTWNDATCTTPQTCSICGVIEGEALGHAGGTATCQGAAICDKCSEPYGELGDHVWQGATCDSARHCELCGENDGEALGHTGGTATCEALAVCDRCGEAYGRLAGHAWVDATCTTPKTCSVCDITEGQALGHTWQDATCTAPKTCTTCQMTDGEEKGHDWSDATCITPKTCSVCGETDGDALGHNWIPATLTDPKTCSVCGTTEGGPLTPLDPAKILGIYFNSADIVADMSSTGVTLSAEPGYMRVLTSGGDANIRFSATSLGVNTSEYPYMVIRYRTTADPVDNWLFVTSGIINSGYNATDGAVLKPQFEKNNEWNNLVINFATDLPALVGKNVEWIRIPCAQNAGDIFDIAHVAFFKTAEDAARFEGYVSNDGCESIGHTWVAASLTAPKTCAVCGETEGEPLTPIDPSLVPGISFKNEPANIDRVHGSGVKYEQEDGFLRVTTTGGDAWVGIKNLIIDTGDYPYMAIRYRISGDRVGNWLYLTDDTVNTGYSGMAGTWGNPKYQIDNQWYTVVYHFPTEFSTMADVNLTGVRLPGAEATGGYLDIEYIAFFKTAEDAARFTGYPERSECEKNGHTWTEASCTTPKTCSVCGATEGEAKGHTWLDATCTAPKTCSGCGVTEGEAKGHTWSDATCTAPKTCSECGATEGEAKGHTWVDATTEAPKTCEACGVTEGEPETEPVTDPDTETVTEPVTEAPTDDVTDQTQENTDEIDETPTDENSSDSVTEESTDTSDKGCKGSILSCSMILMACACAVVLRKKKD